MRISKEKAQSNHDHVVNVAARLFRERGFDGIGVADLMKSAGFTHGGFYNHFPSKDALAVKAADLAFKQRAELTAKAASMEEILSRYISREHVEDRAGGCPGAGLGGDAARQTNEVKTVFGDGIEAIIVALETALGDHAPQDPEERRALAVNVLSKSVGAVVLARAMPADSTLADEIIQTSLTGALRDTGVSV